MIKINFKHALVGTLVIVIGFLSSSTALSGEGSSIKKVAIVSFSVSDVAGSVRAGSVGSTSVPDLIKNTVNGMLNDAEKKLGKKWTVTKVSGFIDNGVYRKAGVPKTLSVFVPKVNGKDMPVFTEVSKEIKGGQIEAQKARLLCKALNVDAVVLIFSEWSAKTGSFVPTTKAITKNVFTVWDKTGKQVIKKRVDTVGNKTLGAGGIKAVNKETIGEWHESYKSSMDKIIGSL
jgi:hypothetical protein